MDRQINRKSKKQIDGYIKERDSWIDKREMQKDKKES